MNRQWKNQRKYVSALLTIAFFPLVCRADGLTAIGNTDGVLTWNLGALEPGKSVREVVLFVCAHSSEEAEKLLKAARKEVVKAASLSAAAQDVSAPERVWIKNDVTDFSLQGTGFYCSAGIGRQGLVSPHGGQLSQFAYDVHYRDDAGEHRAGTPLTGKSLAENLQVVESIHPLSEREAVGVMETADKKLRIRLRAMMGEGAVVAVEFVLTNLVSGSIHDIRLTNYAKIEAAHTMGDDFGYLDATTAGLFVFDSLTKQCVVMAGLDRPATGYVAKWDSKHNSFPQLQGAKGVAFNVWKPLPTTRMMTFEVRNAQGCYMPVCVENPATPETRTLGSNEEMEVLERDWIFQAMGEPLKERALKEIRWGRDLAARLIKNSKALNLKEDLTELDALQRRLQTLAAETADAAKAKELYLAVCRVKWRIMLKNPVLDFTRLLFIDQPYSTGREARHEAIHRLGIHATPGGRLLVLDGLRPGGQIRKLAPEKPGSFWRPDLSFDATQLLYCYKAHDEKSFHLYEMNLEGAGIRQLTSSDYDDVDPIYLPDGHILFTTTRGHSYVRCGPFINSYVLARCEADGSNVYLISLNNEPDFVPSLLNDGRVIYSRWEYSDKPLWRLQKLWTTKQDGTATTLFWGNQSVWPDHTAVPRQIPGSRRVMFAGVGHHDWWSGSIGIVDPDKGRDYPNGLTKVTADLRWPECSIPPVDPHEAADYHASGRFTGYQSPYPLSEEDFLVSARGEGDKFRLYLMDVHGNRELIYEGAYNVLHALPVKPRSIPPQQPDSVVWPGIGKDRKPAEPGFFYSADICQGVPGLRKGMVKYLRVIQSDYKNYSTWKKTYRHSGPPVSIVQEETVKRILSEVPVKSDGSVYFKIPAGRAVFFQLLDEQHRCLQTMRSFTGVMPGERRGCLGCHESHSMSPPQQGGLAVRRPPTEISPPPWGTESISYERFAQPVLDRYCVKCHQGDDKTSAEPNLTLRSGVSVFKEPYLTLVGSAGWQNPIPAGKPGYGIAGAIPVETMDDLQNARNDPKSLATLQPMKYLSYSSRLIELASSGKHHDVRVDSESLRRLIAWVDACCPFMGEEELRALGDPDFAGIEELPIRPRVKTAPVVERP